MGNYTTQSVVRQRAGFAGNLNIATSSITAAIATADAIIDANIYGIYQLPMTETPSLITEIATHLSIGQVLIDNYGIQDEEMKKNGKAHIDFASELLKQIRDRKIKLLSSASTEMTTVTADLPSFYPTDTSYASTTDSTAPALWINREY